MNFFEQRKRVTGKVFNVIPGLDGSTFLTIVLQKGRETKHVDLHITPRGKVKGEVK